MNLKPQNKTTNGIKFSLDRALPPLGAPLVILALMVSGSWSRRLGRQRCRIRKWKVVQDALWAGHRGRR